MHIRELRNIEKLYKNCDQLLSTGRFGEGLWPVSPEVGHFMYWLIRFYKLKRGVEVGAGVGFSTAWLVASSFAPLRPLTPYKGNQPTPAKEVVDSFKLISLEYYLPKVEQWEKHMQKLFGNEYEQIVQIVPSEFTRWIKYKSREKYDFVFFDQRKEHYLSHLKLILPSLKKGAFICADNVISHADACREYLDFVKNDKSFVSVTLELGDGVEVSRYLGSRL